jgi:ankyrin repeat protein
VKALLAAPGIDVKQTNKSGRTPLRMASEQGRTEVVELLLAAPGINVNQIKKAVNSTKRVNIKNLLTKAVKNREAAAAAKTEQEEKNAQNAANREAAAKAEQEAKNAKNAANREAAIKNARNKTNLFTSIRDGKYEVNLIDRIKTLHGNVNHKFTGGMTLLHYAALQGKEDVVKELLENGAKVDEQNKLAQTALYLASQNGRTEVVKALLKKGANFNLADLDGNTPLRVASRAGKTEVVKLLLEKGANVKLKGKDNTTPFQVATNNEIKVLLLEKGGAIIANLTNVNKQALLRQAITNKKLNVVNSLIKAGAKVNSVPNNLENGNLKKLLVKTIEQQNNSSKPALGYRYNNNETLKKYLRTENGRKALRSSYQKYKLSNNNNSIGSVFKLLKRSKTLNNVKNLNNLLEEYKDKLNTYNSGTPERKELEQAIKNINTAKTDQAKANKAAANKAAANKAAAIKAVANKAIFAEEIKKIKSGNFKLLTNDIFTSLSDSELKGILQALSGKGSTNDDKEMMKKLLKKWIENGKTLNNAELAKTTNFIKSLEPDIKKITNNYALRQKFIGTESKISESTFGWNDPNTIKKALLSQNGRQKIITTYGLPIPLNSPIPEIVSALHGSKQPKFVNTVKLNSLKKEYQRLRDAYSDNTSSVIYTNLTDAINSIPNNPNAVSANANANAELRAKVNQVKKSIPEGLLNNPQAIVGLVLKSNGSPYKLVNYTKLKNAINKFKDTGKNQPLNNNTIITNAAKGTWNLVEVPRNLLA